MSTDMGLGIVHASVQTGHQHPAQRPSCYPVQLNSKAVVWAPFMMVLSQDTEFCSWAVTSTLGQASQ